MVHELEDLPNPSVADVDQRQQLPGIPVTQTEPLRVQVLPPRTGGVWGFALSTTLEQILFEDNRRRRAVLVADSDILIAHGSSAACNWWPARVPLVHENAGPLWAKVGSGSANLTVVSDFWAD